MLTFVYLRGIIWLIIILLIHAKKKQLVVVIYFGVRVEPLPYVLPYVLDKRTNSFLNASGFC